MNIAHRDIKPKNIIYFNNGKIFKITDFGVSKLHQNLSTVTKSKKAFNYEIGTRPYLPPDFLKLVNENI